MAQESGPKGQVKQQLRTLQTAAAAAFGAGDYGRVRQLNLQIIRLAPDTDIGRAAATQTDNLRTDPYAIYIGLSTLAAYGLAWILALH